LNIFIENQGGMRKLFEYIFRLGNWIFEANHIIFVIVPSLLIVFFRNEIGKEVIELCGGVMQLVGTVYGIILFVKVREAFSFPSLFDLFNDWRKRFPRWRKDTRFLAGNISIPMIQNPAKASNLDPDNPNLPLEERLNRILRNQEALKKGLDNTQEDLAKQYIELSTRIESLEGNFSSEINQVNTKLESIHMEDFPWALTGLLFILIGSVFSNFAEYLV
jgi:hypothetical protein